MEPVSSIRRLCVLALALPLLAHAQADFPAAKPITLVVGYPPGGSTDLVGRIVATELAKRLGQSVVVENVGGSGGTIGAQKVANAAADGYTLLLGTNNEMAIAKLIQSSVRYDPANDFTPIGLIASQPMVLVASTKSGVRTIGDFVALTRKHPGKYSFGSSGVGSALHLAGEMVKESAGLFIVHIPYRGVAPLTTDLVGGQLEFGVFVLSSGLPQIRSGKVVALGITETKPSKVAPEIPPLATDAALRKVDISSWFGVWGPSRLPAPVVNRLRAALAETLATPEVRVKLEENGATLASPNAQLAAVQRDETAKYAQIVKFANIRE